MYYALSALGGLAGLGMLVCFILVVIKMFQHGQTALGILYIVLLFCCGTGFLIQIIHGFIKQDEWGVRKIMPIYLACFVVWFVCFVTLQAIGQGFKLPT